MASQKILTLLRHAKTEPGAATQNDKDRALVPRGIHAAQAMGLYIAGHEIHPDIVWCSTAVRARQTASYLTTLQPLIEFKEKLYLPSANELLNLAEGLPETVPHAMLIGHNPGIHELAIKLAKTGDDAQINELAVHYPTCTLTTIRFKGSWSDVRHTKGELVRFVVGKTIPAE